MRGSRNFRQEGVQVSLTKNTEVKWPISKKSIFSRFQRGSNIFQGGGGGPTFSRGGGSNCLFPIETHITCDFPGGSGPPVPAPPLGGSHLYIATLSRRLGKPSAVVMDVTLGSFFFKPEKNLEFFRLKNDPRDDYPGRLE